MGRADTERQLERAALTLIQENGVLAGLNLREAADAAGVNRGNVYHYFGSRRHLLQSALRRRLDANYRTVVSHRYPDIADQISWIFRYLIQQKEAVRLAALLVLDGDRSLKVMAFQDENVATFRRLQENGQIDESVDLVALHVFITSFSRGYSLHREHLARETRRTRRGLDEAMLQFVNLFAASLASDPSKTPTPPTE